MGNKKRGEQLKLKNMYQKRKHKPKKVFLRYFITVISLLSLIILVIGIAGNIGDGASPFSCGANCQGGTNELSGHTQEYCNDNPIDCFNTIDNCKDGIYAVFEYINDINVTSLNDTVFRVGDTVEIDVDVFSYSSAWDGVFILYANKSASGNVNWTSLYAGGFAVKTPSTHFRVNITLDNVIGNHSIRAIVEYNQYNNITCGKEVDADWPLYSDTDDITFYVAGDTVNPKINFISPTPQNRSTVTATAITINVSHNDTRPGRLILSWNNTNQTPITWTGIFTNITLNGLTQGNYTYYIWINDTTGNENRTETRTVEIITPIDITIQNPAEGSTYSSRNINLNFTARSNIGNAAIGWAAYSLNGNDNITVAGKLNISVDSSDVNGILNESNINHANLSQSFTVNEIMEITNISIKIMKIGNGTKNAALQIRTDNSGPSGTILAKSIINNSLISNSSFGWVNIALNQSLTLQENTIYWIFLNQNGTIKNHYLWEANDDNIYTKGNYSNNASRDLLFRIFDDYRFRTIINVSEGHNNIILNVNDTAGSNISSSAISFISDTIAPAYTAINISSALLEIGNTQTIRINVSDASTSVNKVLLEYNGTNYSMAVETNQRYYFSCEPNTTGQINYKFHMNDTVNNKNSTPAYSFNVADTLPPAITNITYSPNSADDLDPNTNITFTISVTDPGGIDSVLLQYKNSSGLDWMNSAMINLSGNSYAGNFTPDSIANWTFRIWANDTTGNNNISTNSTLLIDYDWSWIRNPAQFDPIGAIIGTTAELGNLTINNTGDYNLTFNLSSITDPPAILFNKTSPFVINAKNKEIIHINTTVPYVETEYNIIIRINPTNAGAYPNLKYTNVTLAVYSSGPYLLITIAEYSSSATIGSRIRNIAAKITNIGNETAANAIANWTIPGGWTTAADLNKSLGNLSVGQTKWHNISVEVGSSASTGTQTITIEANCSEGKYNSDSRSVSVSSSESTPPGNSGTSSGSGSSSVGGSGLTYKIISYDLLINAPDTIRVFPDTKINVTINVTNTIENMIFNDLTMKVNGYFMVHQNIYPELIHKLGYNETKTFNLEINVPKYMKDKAYVLNISISAYGKSASDNNTNSSPGKRIRKQFPMLIIIQELGREEILQMLLKAGAHINEMKTSGFNIEKTNELLAEAGIALEKGDHRKIREIYSQILTAKEKAFSAYGLIGNAHKKIEESRKKGISVNNALKILEQAKRSFENGDYELAEELANKAFFAAEIEKSSPKFLSVVGPFLKDNWLFLILITLFLSASGLIIRTRVSSKYISNKLKGLEAEESSVLELIKKIQKQHFIDKIMGHRLYKKTTGQLRERIGKINEAKINLKSRHIGILKFSTNINELEKEMHGLKEAIKALQRVYFREKIMPLAAYEKSMNMYKDRIAEIEKRIMIMDKKREKKDVPIEKNKEEQGEISKESISEFLEKEEKIKKVPKNEALSLKEDKERNKNKERKKEVRKEKKEENNNSISNVKRGLAEQNIKDMFKLLEKDIEKNRPKGIESKREKPIRKIEQEIIKHEKNKIHSLTNPKEYFYVNNSRELKNLDELLGALKSMNDETFHYHVNDEKNDFANWVNDVFKNRALSGKLKNAGSRGDMISIIGGLK